MKAKNILMTLLLVTGAIAAKASGYPPELALVSQPVMVYNYNSVTVYYDVENIGDYTYRGYVYLYLDPDDGYYYAREYVRVYPGRIKRIAVEIPAYRANPGWIYTVMPYYELDRELYSFTTFEYFEPLEFWWNGPRSHHYIVINVPPRPRYYHRPGHYRYYYDGFRPPMPPPGHGPMPPLDPHHHTYGYHHEHGGYPANNWNEGSASGSNHNEAPSATVRPKANAGSMSSGSYNNSTNPPAPVNNSSSSNGSSSGRTGNTGSNSGRIDNGANSGSSSGRTGNNSGTSRVNSGSSSSSSGRTGNNSGTSRVNNGSSSSSSGRSGNNSSTSRVNSGSSSSSSGRSGNNSGTSRVNSGSSSTRSSGTRSSGSSSTRSSSSSNSGSSSRSGSSNSSGRGGR